MVSATAADDPIRAAVERALRQTLDVSVGAPLRATARVQRCVVRRLRFLGPLATPLEVAQSMLDQLVDAVSPSDSSLAGYGTADGTLGSIDHTLTTATPATVQTPSTTRPRDGADDVVAALAIEDYESLAASQVVTRLPSLTPDELTAVQSFETAHRGRRTILGKIEQLLG